MRELPLGLSLCRLPDRTGPEHARARDFCLAVIREFYGFDYRADWHGDLDSLLVKPVENQFSMENRGAFWTLAEPSGGLAATAAIKRFTWQPRLVEALRERYPEPDRIATLVRVYVRNDLRGQGLGAWLNELCEHEARALGYRELYLHASSDAPATLAFWQSAGYAEFGAFGFSTHFDKRLT